MRNSAVPPYVPLALLVSLFGFWGLSWWQRRRTLAYFFDTQKTDEQELQHLSKELDKLNEHCRTNSFYAQRLAHIALQGHDVLLAYGQVSAHGGRGSSSQMTVYAVGRGDEIEWMRRFSDIFELAFDDSGISVFWVKLGLLMRLTGRSSGPLAAPRPGLR